jgi:hypothetical protein
MDLICLNSLREVPSLAALDRFDALDDVYSLEGLRNLCKAPLFCLPKSVLLLTTNYAALNISSFTVLYMRMLIEGNIVSDTIVNEITSITSITTITLTLKITYHQSYAGPRHHYTSTLQAVQQSRSLVTPLHHQSNHHGLKHS